ncbi:MAG: holo-ACP synthase [Chloroflexota bacterium]|nr:holo-ACP synthase [Chloroflexota bacterium]
MHVNGIDIIEISRIRKAVDSWGERFLERVYTAREIEHCRGRAPELAARFAGKEAVMKALGTGKTGISSHDIEILVDQKGAPVVHLTGTAQTRAVEIGLEDFAITISHSREYAVASVVGGKQV